MQSDTRSGRKLESIEDLEIWQKSHNLCEDIFKQGRGFPISEWSALGQRLKNAALDVPVHIERGFHKRAIPDKIYHYQLAWDSFIELRYLIRVADSMGYLKKANKIQNQVKDVEQMFTGLIRSMEKRSGTQRNRQGSETPPVD